MIYKIEVYSNNHLILELKTTNYHEINEIERVVIKLEYDYRIFVEEK